MALTDNETRRLKALAEQAGINLAELPVAQIGHTAGLAAKLGPGRHLVWLEVPSPKWEGSAAPGPGRAGW